MFTTTDPRYIELVFFEKGIVIESFDGDQRIDCDNCNGGNMNIQHR
jgi:hypothetical protein